uniref:Uncharacterized protein n=1 Tax=Arundo donax TaxID=35708 RepID=A0A0A9D8I7_ARUDO
MDLLILMPSACKALPAKKCNRKSIIITYYCVYGYSTICPRMLSGSYFTKKTADTK